MSKHHTEPKAAEPKPAADAKKSKGFWHFGKSSSSKTVDPLESEAARERLEMARIDREAFEVVTLLKQV